MLSTTPLAIGKPVAMPPTRDASLDLLEDRLDSWAKWRKGANRIAPRTAPSPLSRLQAEGAEVDRGSKHVREAEVAAAALHLFRRRKQAEHKRMVMILPFGHPEKPYHERQVEHYRKLIGKTPRTIQQMAWASLIAGHGHRAEPDYPEEEATQAAVVALPGHLRDVVEEMYLAPLPAHIKAVEMCISERTLWYRMKLAKVMLADSLGLHSP